MNINLRGRLKSGFRVGRDRWARRELPLMAHILKARPAVAPYL